MAVTVKIPAQLRTLTGNEAEAEVEGGSVGEALEALYARYDGLRDRITENGELRRFVNVYVGGEDIRFGDGLETPVNDGDEITILPAVAGGRRRSRLSSARSVAQRGCCAARRATGPASGGSRAGRSRRRTPCRPSDFALHAHLDVDERVALRVGQQPVRVHAGLLAGEPDLVQVVEPLDQEVGLDGVPALLRDLGVLLALLEALARSPRPRAGTTPGGAAGRRRGSRRRRRAHRSRPGA